MSASVFVAQRLFWQDLISYEILQSEPLQVKECAIGKGEQSQNMAASIVD